MSIQIRPDQQLPPGAENARTVGRYASLDRLPGNTGSSIQRQMATLKARLIARYRLHTVPGRPEELAQQTIDVEIDGQHQDTYHGKTVSIGYGCGTIRIRKHDGRQWIQHLDLQPNDGWHAQVYQFLDSWMSYVDPNKIGDVTKQRENMERLLGLDSAQPIRDNPQA